MSQYQHDPKAKYFGFKSWNDFFTRKLVKGVSISDPDDNKVAVSACDSTVYRICHNVKRFAKFWLKSQPYSLLICLLETNTMSISMSAALFIKLSSTLSTTTDGIPY